MRAALSLASALVFFQLYEGEDPVPACVVRSNEDESLDLAVFTGDHVQPVRTFRHRKEDIHGGVETWRHDFEAAPVVEVAPATAPTEPAPPVVPPADPAPTPIAPPAAPAPSTA